MWRQWIGRAAGSTAAGILLLLLALPMALIALLVALSTRSNPIFSQDRIGLHETAFVLYKFRTMTDLRDRDGRLLPDNLRLTLIGRLLRKTSLDELPQLWNIVRGEMAFVGPRPLLPAYLPRYASWQRRRHEVMPGITGWVQVNGRNSLSWDEKFALDVWYVDHKGLALDLKILWLTLISVVRRRGISAEGHATMPEFLGANANRADSSGQ